MKRATIKLMHVKTALLVKYAGGWLWQPERAAITVTTAPTAYAAYM